MRLRSISRSTSRACWITAASLAVTACSTSAARPTLTSEPIPDTTVLATTPTTVQTVVASAPPLSGAIQFEVVNSFPHDSTAFTQGLEFVGSELYESTGLRGESDLRITDPETGEVLQEAPLEATLFGEGMTVRDGLVYQLTYTSGLLFIADADTLEPAREPISYEGEGWGLCTTELGGAGRPLVMSNGSSELTIRDPETFEIQRVVPVVDERGQPVLQINELECTGSHVLANIWQSEEIISIDLTSGRVTGRLDLTELVPDGVEPTNSVLNGIAYRASTDTYFVTGKLWPVMYELRLTSG